MKNSFDNFDKDQKWFKVFFYGIFATVIIMFFAILTFQGMVIYKVLSACDGKSFATCAGEYAHDFKTELQRVDKP